MLRHDVFNRIYIIIQMNVDILRFNGAEVLKAFEQVCFILATHLIDMLCGQCRGKLLITWESSAFLLGQQRIDKLLDIAISGVVVP